MMDKQEYPFWMTVGETEILKFSDLPHLIAKAQHPMDDETWEYAAARINLAEQLPECVHRGELTVRNASGLGMQTFPHGQALQDSIVLPQDLDSFLHARGIGLRRTKQPSSSRVLIADLANELSRDQADAFPSWAKDGSDNDLRRDIAVAINVFGLKQNHIPGIMQHIRQMAVQGFIVPRSAFNGMPAANPEQDIDETWLLSGADAENVKLALAAEGRQRLRTAKEEAERKSAGRYTLQEAADELAVVSGWTADRWLQVIRSEVKNGNLPLKNPKDFTDRLPYSVPAFLRNYDDEISSSDMDLWLASHADWNVVRVSAAAATEPKDSLLYKTEAEAAIPGKIPRVSIGKLAVKAAWRIESQSAKKATAKQVIELLKQWAIEGAESETLRGWDERRRAVVWITYDFAEKFYDESACGKTLEAWNRSRA